MGLFKKLLDSEYKELKRFESIADQIVLLDEEMQKLKILKLYQRLTLKFLTENFH